MRISTARRPTFYMITPALGFARLLPCRPAHVSSAVHYESPINSAGFKYPWSQRPRKPRASLRFENPSSGASPYPISPCHHNTEEIELAWPHLRRLRASKSGGGGQPKRRPYWTRSSMRFRHEIPGINHDDVPLVSDIQLRRPKGQVGGDHRPLQRGGANRQRTSARPMGALPAWDP